VAIVHFPTNHSLPASELMRDISLEGNMAVLGTRMPRSFPNTLRPIEVIIIKANLLATFGVHRRMPYVDKLRRVIPSMSL
jgi:hypothetical protein